MRRLAISILIVLAIASVAWADTYTLQFPSTINGFRDSTGAQHQPDANRFMTTTSLKGLDALLSIVQMPKGVPVACVAIDNLPAG